jgi:hypothetical protein
VLQEFAGLVTTIAEVPKMQKRVLDDVVVMVAPA